jgi:hypothetical protein
MSSWGNAREGLQFRGVMLALAAMLIATTSAGAALTYTNEADVPLNQSATDTLNGLVPAVWDSNGSTITSPGEGSLSYLTDATSSDSPAGHMIARDNVQNVYYYWDLSGVANASELRQLDVWVAGGDENRNHINAEILGVVNGEWQMLAGYIPFDPVANAGYDHARWQWDAGDVTNLSGLCVVMSFGPYGQSARIVEMDATLVPEPATLAMLVMGGLAMLRKRNVKM